MKKITLFVLVILAAACSTTRDRDRLTDPEIAMVMRVANLGEVREGNVARQKATDPAVRDFATMMVNEHGDANVKAEEQLAKKEIPSDDSPLSRQIDAGSAAAADSLRASAAGPAFDRAYMNRQVEAHESVLTTIDKTLVPAAHSSVVKQVLKDMRATVEKHLEKAKQIRTALK